MPFRIAIETVWRFTQERDGRSMLVMLDFLVRDPGDRQDHARGERAQVSYRHAWNLIEKWSEFFGTPLVERRQGRGSVLTNFGERLVWAGQRLQARLGPQLQNLAQELESEINALLPDGGAAVRIHAVMDSPSRRCAICWRGKRICAWTSATSATSIRRTGRRATIRSGRSRKSSVFRHGGALAPQFPRRHGKDRCKQEAQSPSRDPDGEISADYCTRDGSEAHGKHQIAEHASRPESAREKMPRHASDDYGQADEYAGGAGCPDVEAESEHERRDDEFPACNAEQTAQCADQETRAERHRNPQCSLRLQWTRHRCPRAGFLP